MGKRHNGSMRRCLTAVVLAAPLLAAGAPAADARSRDLWATVNICDTERYPNMMGVRARMPGNGTRARMYMRFQAQFYNPVLQRWTPTGARTGFRYVGSARFRWREAGHTFSFRPPAPGASFRLRGLVHFKWRGRRRGRAVVRRARRQTRQLLIAPLGADPPGFSAGRCTLSG